MSSIDERVVQMQFQNSQFEKGVKETLKSLDELKKSLKLDEAADGLRKLQEAGDSFSLAKVGDSVDGLTERFSVFGTFAARIVENLADTVYNKLGNAIKSVTVGQIGAGWEKYATDTEAVQTIMFATKKPIQEVEEELRKLTFFTDETSYSYQDMVGNIAKFTSNNIDLTEARVSMQGIATWAASAGQNAATASRAMYNISQAMGVGAMKAIDWKSIELANMATADFKQNAINAAIALGTLDSAGRAMDKHKTQVTIDNFRETLQTGWFTKDVMLKVFGQYGEFAEKVEQLVSETGMDTSDAIKQLSGTTELFSENAFKAAQEAKTFKDAVEALRDATSTKWLNIFKLIFGNYEQAKDLWTKLANDLYEVFVDPLDDLIGELRVWHELPDGEGSWADFMQGLYDIMDGLKGLLITVRDALGDLIPTSTLEMLKSFSLGVKEFGASFKAAFGIPEEAAEEAVEAVEKVEEAVVNADGTVKRVISMTKRALNGEEDTVEDVTNQVDELQKKLAIGARGEEVKQMQEMLMGLGFKLDNFGADSIFGPETQAALKEFQYQSGLAITGVFDEATKQKLSEAFELGEVQKGLQELHESLAEGARGEEVKALQRRLIELGYDLGTYGADGIYGPKTRAAVEAFERDYGMAVDGIWDEEDQQALAEKLGYPGVLEAVEEVQAETEKAGDATEKYSNKLSRIQTIIGGIAAAGRIVLKVVGFIGNVLKYVWDLTEPIRDAFGIAAAAIGDALISFDKWLGESGVIDQWFESVKQALEPFGNWMKSAADAFLEFFGLKKPAEESNKEVMTFSKLWKSLKESIKNSGFITSITNAWNSLKGAFEKIKPTIQNVWKAFKENLGTGFSYLLKGLEIALGLLIAPIGLLFDGLSKLIGFIADKIPLGVEKLKEFWASLTFEGDESLGKAPGILRRVKNFADSIVEFLFGKEYEDGSRKIGVFTRIGRLINGDLDGFVEGMSEEDANKALEIVTTIQGIYAQIRDTVSHIFEYIGALFTGNFGQDTSLTESDQASILSIHQKIKMVGEAIKLLFTGEESENPLLSEDLRGKIQNFRNNVSSTIESVKNTIGHVFTWIWTLFTGNFASATNLSIDEKATILKYRNRIRSVGSSFKLLFTGENDGFVPESIASGIESFRGAVESFVNTVGDNIKKVWPTLKLLFTGDIANTTLSDEESEKVINFRNGIIDFFGSIGESFKKIWAAIKYLFTGSGGEDVLKPETIEKLDKFRKGVSDVFDRIKTAFGGLWDKLKDIFKNGISFESIKQAISAVGEALSTVFGSLWSTAKKIVLWGGIGYILVQVVKMISNISGLTKNMSNGIKGFKGNSEKLSTTILKIAGAIAIIAGAIWLLGTQMDKKQFDQGLIGFGLIVGAIVGIMALSKVFSKNNGAKDIKKTGNAVQSIGVGVALIAAAIYFLGKAVDKNTFWKGVGYLTVIMSILAAFMIGLSLFEKKIKTTTSISVAGKIWQLAAVILAMAVAVRILGHMDIDKAGIGVGALLGIMVSLGLFMRLASKYGQVKLKGLISLSLAIIVMSMVVRRLGKMKFGDALQGVAAVGIILGLIAIIARTFGKYGKDIKTTQLVAVFLGVAAVIGIFGYVISKIKDVNPLTMVAFSGSLAVALAAFVIACKSAGKLGGGGSLLNNDMFKGALSIVLSLAMFAAAALLLVGGIGWLTEKFGSEENPTSAFETGKTVLKTTAEAIRGFVEALGADVTSVVGYLAVSTISGLIDNTKGGKNAMLKGARDIVGALMIFAVSALVLVGGVGALDFIDEETDIVSVFKKGSDVLTTTGTAIKGFIDALGLSWPDIALILGAATLIGATPGLNWKTPLGAFQIGLAFDIIAGMLEALVGTNGVINRLSNGNWEKDLEDGGKCLEVTAKAIKGFIDTLGLSWPDIALIMGVATILGSVPALGWGLVVGSFQIGLAFDIIIGMLELMVGVNGIANKLTNGGWESAIDEGGKVLGALGKAIASFITGAMDEFSRSINDFSDAITKFLTSINGVSQDTNLQNDIDTALGIAGQVYGFFSGLESYATITVDPESGIATYENNAATLSEDIASFGRGIDTLWGAITGLSHDKDVNNDLAVSLQLAGKLQNWFSQISGKMPSGSGLDLYNERINSLLPQIGEYGTNMGIVKRNISGFSSKVTEDDVQAAKGSANAVVDFLKELKLKSEDIEHNRTGIAAWFQPEETTQQTVFDSIKEFGEAMGGAREHFEGIAASSMVRGIYASIDVAKAMAALLVELNSHQGEGAYSDTYVGYVMQNFSQWFDPDNPESLAGMLANFGKYTDSIENFDKVAALFSGFASLANYLSSGEQIQSDFQQTGLDMATNIIVGFGNLDFSTIDGFVQSLLGALAEYETGDNSFETAGGNFAIGLANGVYVQALAAIEAAKYVATEMLNKVKTIFAEASPSKVTTQIGEFFTKGLAIGVENESSTAVKSAGSVAENMLDTAKGTLASLSQILLEGIDDNPVITPVVDMSRAREAADSIGSMFGIQRSGLTMTRTLLERTQYDGNGDLIHRPVELNAESISLMKSDLESISRGLSSMSTTDVVTEVKGMTERFGELAEAVQNMKIILDTGTLVGATSSAYDKQFGLMSSYRERGN